MSAGQGQDQPQATEQGKQVVVLENIPTSDNEGRPNYYHMIRGALDVILNDIIKAAGLARVVSVPTSGQSDTVTGYWYPTGQAIIEADTNCLADWIVTNFTHHPDIDNTGHRIKAEKRNQE